MPAKSRTVLLSTLAGVMLLSGSVAGCGGKSALETRADDFVAAVNAESATSGTSSKDVIRNIIGAPAGENIKVGVASLSNKGVVAGLEKGTMWMREGDACYLVTGYPTKDAVAVPTACDSTTSHVGG